MARKIIRIDGYIGGYYYGKDLLRYELSGTEKEGAVIEISSLGGSAIHAIDMHNQIAAHGNVDIVFTGPSASAATFLAMGAKSVSIVSNAFFLAHKVSSVIDNYGSYNEEELDEMIRELQSLRETNMKFDLVIARIYAKRSGKSIEEILGLMQKNTWITAEEALEWGFADKIIEPTEKSDLINDRFVAMVRSAELPDIPKSPDSSPVGQLPQIKEAVPADEESLFERIWNRFAHRQKQQIPPSNNKEMKTQYLNINNALGIESLECIDNKVFLNQEQMDALEERLRANLQLNTEKENAIQERDQSRTALTNALNQFDAIDPTVASAGTAEEKANAIRTLLASRPAERPAGNLDKNDGSGQPEDGVDWDIINALPHNKEVDNL